MSVRHYHFLILLLLLGGGMVAFSLASPHRQLQLGIGIGVTIVYVAWGVIHHLLEGDLHPKVVLEYGLVGLIATLVLLGTLAP